MNIKAFSWRHQCQKVGSQFKAFLKKHWLSHRPLFINQEEEKEIKESQSLKLSMCFLNTGIVHLHLTANVNVKELF